MSDRQRCIFNVRAINLTIDEGTAITGYRQRRFYLAVRLSDGMLMLGRSKRKPRLSPERYRLIEW